MKLLELKIINFKGIRNCVLTLDGKEANIYGENATGKTTLADAFRWLLFGKNSKNQKDFEIKTLDESGTPLSGVNHEVSAKLDLSGKEAELRRVYYEKWTKKRGSAEKEFTGHSTDYYINGVPAKEKEYKEFISSIIDGEETFKLLIDPYYFSETMSWLDRRTLLFDICGNIKDKDVINSNFELAELTGLLNGRTIEMHKKIVISKRKDINRELNDIPIRIDEAYRAIADGNVDQADESELTAKISSLRSEIDKKRKERILLLQGGGIAEKQKVLAEVESRMEQYRLKYDDNLKKSLLEINSELRTIERAMEDIDRRYSTKQKGFDYNDEEIDRIEENLKELRERWHKIDAESFTYETTMTCPQCGYDLMQDSRDMALAEFNKTKSEALERIQTRGKTSKENADKLRAENKVISEDIGKLNLERIKLDEQATELDKKIDALRSTREDYVNDKKYADLAEKKAVLAAEISRLQDGQNKDAISGIDNEINTAESLLAETEGSLAQIKQSKAIKLRIEDLKKQERNLAGEYERLEKEMHLIERFTAVKAEMIEENINRKFKLARFKLFNPLINGGLEDCCEVMDKNGVPYSTALNKGACINVGLDIINTLASHYGFSAPIFIDNAEAVTDILPTQGQQIKLYVQAGQETLRILTT